MVWALWHRPELRAVASCLLRWVHTMNVSKQDERRYLKAIRTTLKRQMGACSRGASIRLGYCRASTPRAQKVTPFIEATKPLQNKRKSEDAEQEDCSEDQLNQRFHQGSGSEGANLPAALGSLPRQARPVR